MAGSDLLVRDPDADLALLQLVWTTPALWGRLHEKQADWRSALVVTLAERDEAEDTSTLTLRTCAMAALVRLLVAFDECVETGDATTSQGCWMQGSRRWRPEVGRRTTAE